MNAYDMQERIVLEVGNASADLAIEDYDNALFDAQLETWDLPTENRYRILWIKNRAKRHLFFYLASGTARKFQVDGYRLQQRHQQYKAMYEAMDRAFEAEKEKYPDLFPEPEGDFPARLQFGTQVEAGFQYDALGRDTTYSADNQVIFKPEK